MWDLYKQLIQQSTQETVTEVIVSYPWTAVKSRTVGLSMSPQRYIDEIPHAGTRTGKPAHELTQSLTSWNFSEAAIGLAALNSQLNTMTTVEQLTQIALHQLPDVNAFDYLAEFAKGKRVGIIGHFANMGKLQEVSEVTIFERVPQYGDLPDTAEEYLLPEQDIVFLTATTLLNKTAPRILQLCKQAVTVMVGPSTPLSPVLFDYGIDMLSGLVVLDEDKVSQTIREGGGMKQIQSSVKYVNIAKQSFYS